MKVYNIESKQFLPISIEEAWEFLSSPESLKKITPEHMGFEIKYISGGRKMHAGQIINYQINVLPWIAMNWTTEITHTDAPNYFVDEQRFGPYALWHHQHHLKEVDGGVEMIDIVNYAIPLGILGRLAHSIFVKRQLKGIFDFRHAVLEEKFKRKKVLA